MTLGEEGSKTLSSLLMYLKKPKKRGGLDWRGKERERLAKKSTRLRTDALLLCT